MPQINLHLEGDNCWKDIPHLQQQGRLIDCMGSAAPPIEIASLAGGMASGKPSVTIRINLPDGKAVLTETSLELLRICVDAMTEHHAPESAAMAKVTDASMRLQMIAKELKRPLILACHSDSITADGFLYTGYSGEIRPDVDGLTIAHRCNATEAQEIIDLLKGYWKSKRDRQKPKGFGL